MARLVAFLAFAFWAGPVQAENAKPPAMPDAGEIATHVSDNWDLWQGRFAIFAGRKGEKPRLVRVENVTCQRYSGWWSDCELTVTGRFDDGSEVTRDLPTMFDRDKQGRLEEVIVLSHSRSDPAKLP